MNNQMRSDRRLAVAAVLILLLRGSREATTLTILLVVAAHFMFASKALGGRDSWAESIGPIPVRRLATPSAFGDRSSPPSPFFIRTAGAAKGVSGAPAVSSLELLRPGLQRSDSVDPTHFEQIPAGRGGVPTPESADKIEGGVPLTESELEAGLRRNSKERPSVGASDGTASGGIALSPENDATAQLMDRLAGPKAAALLAGRPASYSHRSRARVSAQGAGEPVCAGKNCALRHLAEAVAYSCTAAPGGTACPKSFSHCSAGSCPSEFAARVGGAPFQGSSAGPGQLFLLPSEPVPVMPDAQPMLLAQLSVAQQQQECERGIGDGNSAVSSANRSFDTCCNRVESAWQACAAGCSGDARCLRSCGAQANVSSQTCEQAYMGAYDSISAQEDSKCGAKPGGKMVGLSPWNVRYHCVQH